MGKDEDKLHEIIAMIIERRRGQTRISPSWVATEGMNKLDPTRRSIHLVYIGCHYHLRHLARDLLRKLFEPDAGVPDEGQDDLFPILQWRYPVARTGRTKTEEPEYILRNEMDDKDIAFNVARLRSEAIAKQKHADALEAWGRTRHAA